MPKLHRGLISFFALGNTYLQIAAQVVRLIYYDYESSNTWPGSFWCALFFVAAMVSGLLAMIVQLLAERAVRNGEPERFPVPLAPRALAPRSAEGPCR